MRPLTQSELDALTRWHEASGDRYPEEVDDAYLLANITSELFLADHFERITATSLEAIGFVQIGNRLTLKRECEHISCHRDLSDWAVNGELFPHRRLEPRYMGKLQDIVFQLWGEP